MDTRFWSHNTDSEILVICKNTGILKLFHLHDQYFELRVSDLFITSLDLVVFHLSNFLFQVPSVSGNNLKIFLPQLPLLTCTHSWVLKKKKKKEYSYNLIKKKEGNPYPHLTR